MTVSGLSRYSLSLSVGIAMLAGCGGSQPPIGAPGAMPQGPAIATHAARGKYNAIYSFKGPPDDGADPHAVLLNRSGRFYGTTNYGGRHRCYGKGCGTVFSVTPSGSETLLHSFDAKLSGSAYPNGLIDVNGTLYGSFQGAPDGCGTIFAITPSGKLTVLYTFTCGSDGRSPRGELLNVNGILYGTTFQGGAKYNGSVFAITTSGKLSTLYSFKGNVHHHTDGANPWGGLINVGGVLYGTTCYGGSYGSAYGAGTIFKITTSGKETVLYSFPGFNGGACPRGSLVNVNGVLYGTTLEGGSAGRRGFGTAFAVTRSGKEMWVYSFAGKPLDGAQPNAGLANRNGTLYGTTVKGGTTDHGTLFAITRSGQESVLHDFIGRRNGVFPQAPLINVNSVLYGTTGGGGANTRGTVFAFTP